MTLIISTRFSLISKTLIFRISSVIKDEEGFISNSLELNERNNRHYDQNCH